MPYPPPELRRLLIALLVSITLPAMDPLGAQGAKPALSDAALSEIRAGFEARRDRALESLRGKPLARRKVEPPLFKGNPIPLYRNLSYSLVDFAFKSLWLEDQVKEANEALREHCAIYLDKPDVLQDADSFIWSADELCRIVEYFGARGSRKAGLLEGETEAQVTRLMWQYASIQSRLESDLTVPANHFTLAANPSIAYPWDIEGSENIHLMKVYAKWHLTQILKELPEYRDKPFEEGGVAAVHHAAWTKYTLRYFRERATKGFFVEFANDDYGVHAIKGFYGMADFSRDPTLKKMAGQFLDLFWAAWSQEQIDGVRGGGKARVYRGVQSILVVSTLRKLVWFYTGMGEAGDIRENLFSFVTSGYRLPPVVIDLALDPAGRGVYEVSQRCLGLAQDGLHNPPKYRIRQDDGLARYSWCTPEFIMGGFHCDARKEEEWAMISSQNRWAGIIFAGETLSRIFPQSHTEYRAYNTFWGLQAKGAMIVQKLPDGVYSKYGGPMRVYFSDDGLTNFVEKSGWVFVEARGAYAAVKAVSGETTWLPVDEKYQGKTIWKGRWLVCGDEQSPVILEAARKSDHADFAAFQRTILNLPLTDNRNSIVYKTSYGDMLVFFRDQSRRGTINGKPVDTTPPMAFQSPFLNAAWDSGRVAIQKGSRRLDLDFNLP